MSEIRFGVKAKENLPHLSYIFCKPEQLGKDIKTVACYVIGALLIIEFNIVQEGVKNIN